MSYCDVKRVMIIIIVMYHNCIFISLVIRQSTLNEAFLWREYSFLFIYDFLSWFFSCHDVTIFSLNLFEARTSFGLSAFNTVDLLSRSSVVWSEASLWFVISNQQRLLTSYVRSQPGIKITFCKRGWCYLNESSESLGSIDSGKCSDLDKSGPELHRYCRRDIGWLAYHLSENLKILNWVYTSTKSSYVPLVQISKLWFWFSFFIFEVKPYLWMTMMICDGDSWEDVFISGGLIVLSSLKDEGKPGGGSCKFDFYGQRIALFWYILDFSHFPVEWKGFKNSEWYL